MLLFLQHLCIILIIQQQLLKSINNMNKLSELFQSRNKTQSSSAANIASLFSVPTPQVSITKQSQSQSIKNKHKNTQKIDKSLPKANESQEHQNEQQNKNTKNKNKKVNTKPSQTHQDQEPQNLQTTIFVGNVSLSSTHKQMRKLFSKYGQVQKVWFRSIPVQDNKIGRKASHILKKYQEGADSMNAYVKFTDVEAALKACEQNGTKVEQHTIRVTMCMDKQIDYKRTIFVGNLPFDIKQQQFRNHFQKIGQIDNLRLVKHKITKQGIGIGYIKYKQDQDMRKAIAELNGSTLMNRKIRVKRAVQKQKLQKKIRKLKEKKQKKLGKKPTSNMQYSQKDNKFKKQVNGIPKRKIISKTN